MTIRGPVEHAILEIAGELDFTYASDVARLAVELPHRIVALDLSGLDFIDVAGARAITQIREAVAARCQEEPELQGVSMAVARTLQHVDTATRAVVAHI